MNMLGILAGPLRRRIGRAADVREGEGKPVLWSGAYFFALLCSYYILRPLREEMGITAGVQHLQWLFSATFAAMLLAVPLFGALVVRVPRQSLVPWVCRFFALNLLAFYVLFSALESPARIHAARAFYVWVSLFNLFVVSVFWSVMVDLFSNAQSKRLFGLIAAGGSVGALLGPALTAGLAVPWGPLPLLLVSAALLELAVQCLSGARRALARHAADWPPAPGDGGLSQTPGAAPGRNGDGSARHGATDAGGGGPIGGGVWAGLTQVLRSPYLLGICLYMFLFTATSTFAYFELAHFVADALHDPSQRTRLFALIDLAVSLLTLAVQVGVTGRWMTRLGVGAGLALLPVLTAGGFAVLALAPALQVVVALNVLRRAANFAIARPAREVLFTVVTPEQKYKAKNVIDTLVYRGGDALSGWMFAGLGGLGLGLGAIAWLTVPVAALWLVTGWSLGRAQQRRADAPALVAVSS